MNVSVRKILIAAFVAFYLSCETSAAAIEGEDASVGSEEAEFGAEGAGVATEEPGVAAEEPGVGAEEAGAETGPGVEAEATTAAAETAVAATEDCKSGITFKCGNLECSNGSFCVIKETPSDDQKTITKTTQCRDEHDTVLEEEIATEDIPDGEIPFNVIKRKTLKQGKNGSGFFGSSSYAGSFRRGNLGSFRPGRIGMILRGNADKEDEKNEENSIDFDFDDDKRSFGFLNYFDKALKGTSDLMHNVFRLWPC